MATRKKASKVYIVTSGSYSDYRICCVFSNKADAEAYVERHNRADKWNDYQWEDYPLDSHVAHHASDQMPFQLTYYHRPRYARSDSWYATGKPDGADLPFEDVRLENGTGPGLQTWVWARDKDDAIKKASDRIMQYVASNEGVNASDEGPGFIEYLDVNDTPFLTYIKNYPQEFSFRIVLPEDDDAQH